MSTEERAPRTRKAKAKPIATATGTESAATVLTVAPTINASESIDDGKSECSDLELAFARAVADGRKATAAYRMVWGDCRSADVSSTRVMQRPRVQRQIQLYRDELNKAFIGSAVERRKVLWDTIRAKPKDRPGHGDRIQAIKLDAQLAGELEPQRDTVNITLGVVLGSLTGHSIKQAEQAIDIDSVSQGASAQASTSERNSTSDGAQCEPIAPAAVAGPFGCIKGVSPATRSTTQGARQSGPIASVSPARAIVVDED